MSDSGKFLDYDKPSYSDMPFGERSEKNPIPYLFHNFVNVAYIFSFKHFKESHLTQVDPNEVKNFFSDLMDVLNNAENMMKNGSLVQTPQANINSLEKFKEFLQTTSKEIGFNYSNIYKILKEFRRTFRPQI